ncbi:hypothetical protein A1Q2_03881 [Trichosporon asahii var. asahii CBS 8904]|uniref:Uncharacterized protein n=1 Tax=Trichosporon asahii var. asahii (strain CBS 8904) TaxID=1220162 RepID=K1VYJ2_TRIAC|nr:hypothetical protein A1Q2_03881 [Trichosporon asahii var. asahii CBS 8904]
MAARVMMSAVREEAAMVSTEALAAARSTVTTEAGAVTRQAAEAAFNPLAAKEAAEANARNVVHTTEKSLLEAMGRGSPVPGHVGTPKMTSSTSTVGNTILGEVGAEASATLRETTVSESTIVGKVLEQDMGVSVKEAMTNAGETGVQAVTEQAVQVAEAVLDGKFADTGKAVLALKEGAPKAFS